MPRDRIPTTFEAHWAHAVAWLLCRGVWRVTRVGAKNVPAAGPVIIAGNHTSFLDGPMLMGMSPRPAHFLIKNELSYGIGGRILRRAGQVFVDRGNGRAALMTSLELLRQGRVVGIFPEGGRGSGRVQDVKAGVAWLAVHGNAPVVPVACLGTRMSGQGKNRIPGFKHKIYVEFGEPIDIAAMPGPTRQKVAEGMEAVKTALQELVEAASERSGIPLPADDGSRPGHEHHPEHHHALADPQADRGASQDHGKHHEAVPGHDAKDSSQ